MGIVGAGQMGTGIAIVGNRHANLDVKILDTSQQQLDASRTFIGKLDLIYQRNGVIRRLARRDLLKMRR